MLRILACALLLLAVPSLPARAAGLTADDIRAAVAAAAPDGVVDLSGKSLQDLDLSGLDLRRAKLAHADLYGAKLVGADLSGADLTGANLNLTWLMRANFSGATLAQASLQGLVVSPGLDIDPAQVPVFKGADFSGARIVARFSQMDLSGANFAHAMLGADMRNQSMGLMRTDFSGANLAEAKFEAADLGRASFRFAKLAGADFKEARLIGADFSGADLTGADLTGADATDADFGDALLKDVVGLDTVKGQHLARPGG